MSIKRKMNYCYLFCTLFLVVACQLESEQVNKSNTGVWAWENVVIKSKNTSLIFFIIVIIQKNGNKFL